jgi:hypothetical protein
MLVVFILELDNANFFARTFNIAAKAGKIAAKAGKI